jgi:hypothetical protein
MPTIPSFYSVNEAAKPADKRVYHNNSTCPPGRDIPQNERRVGDNGYSLCKDCASRNANNQ